MAKIRSKRRQRRPKIKELVCLEVWVKAGGRCCICNEFLLQDAFTRHTGKFGELAHMIALGKNGPRNLKEVKLSEVDLNSASNIMLLCKTHHRMVDHEQRSHFNLQRLKRVKYAHERRIKKQTSVNGTKRPKVIKFFANIAEQDVNIPLPDVIEALEPNYPVDDGNTIDLSGPFTPERPNFWKQKGQEVEVRVKEILSVNLKEDKFKSVAIFALAPIPLLFKLGRCLSDKVDTFYFQRHRLGRNKWSWRKSGEVHDFGINSSQNGKKGSEVVLILSISGKISLQQLPKELLDLPTYEIAPTGTSPSRTILSRKETFDNYQRAYIQFLDSMQSSDKKVERIHILPAIPAPIAVFSGQQRVKADPRLIIYETQMGQPFRKALEV